jgi:endonuclease YncB( thermonuclease family)
MRAALVLLLVLASAAATASEACRAIDGDTLICGRERVRVRGVYAAERGQPGGLEARDRLARLIRSGDLQLVRRAHDRYGRTIADVYVDGKRIRQRDIGPRAGSGSGHGR